MAIPVEKTITSSRIYDGSVINVRVDEVELPNGRRTKREIVEHRGAVAVLPLHTDGKVTLVRQFRKAVEKELLEVPAGRLEEGESPEACARRELEEETGLRAGRLEPLTSCYSTPGFSNEMMHVFLATSLTESSQRPEFDEMISLEKFPLAKASELIRSGEIMDAKTIIAMLLASSALTPGRT